MNCDFPLTQATTALGMTDGQVALLVRELAFPPGKSTAEIKEMFINDLAAAKIITVPEPRASSSRAAPPEGQERPLLHEARRAGPT